MSENLESKYAKQQNFDGVDYTIYDIKQAAMDCDFEIEKLPYSLRVLFENVVRNNGSEKSLLSFHKWLKEKNLLKKLIICLLGYLCRILRVFQQ